jgi:hypothetical protein
MASAHCAKPSYAVLTIAEVASPATQRRAAAGATSANPEHHIYVHPIFTTSTQGCGWLTKSVFGTLEYL